MTARLVLILAFALLCGGFLTLRPAYAQNAPVDLASRKTGPSGLPVPRFVSLKADEVNVRRGPGWDHEVAWVFRRAGLPVEVIAEFDVWRQIRDSEGATGWVIGSLLSGRRTVLVAPWQPQGRTLTLHGTASGASGVKAMLSSGVLGDVEDCDGSWCRISVSNVSGYITQDLVWGAYPGEKIN